MRKSRTELFDRGFAPAPRFTTSIESDGRDSLFVFLAVLCVYGYLGRFWACVVLSASAVYLWLPRMLVFVVKWEERRQLRARMPKRILLLRHAQSLGNVDSTTYQKMPDNQIPITKKGEKEALQAGRKLRALIGDKQRVRFFVSPYKRSKLTLEGIIKGMDIDKRRYTVREDARLREQDWGNLQNEEDIKNSIRERRSFGSFYYRFPAGESGADVFDRATSFLSTLHREFNHKNCMENFCLVTHGITLRLILMRYFKWTVDEFHQLHNPSNCQIIQLDLQPETLKYKLVTPLIRSVPELDETLDEL